MLISHLTHADVQYRSRNLTSLLSFMDPERGGFGEIFPEVINIITEENISLNPPSGGSINDILYQKYE